MKPEIFKDIILYEWYYQISNYWNVKSLSRIKDNWKVKYLSNDIILRPWKNRCWYLTLFFYKDWIWKWFKIHRLVWIYFKENPENKPEINHIDWNKLNNYEDNIEWCTKSENLKHAYRLWLNNKFINFNPNKWKFWKYNANSKIVYQYDKDLNFIKKWYSIADIYNNLWIHRTNISQVCNWNKKSAWWFIFSFNKIFSS
jgi:hypothetical protein